MSARRSSLEKFRLKRALETLVLKEGRGTELVSLYVPPGRQISDVVTALKQEYGTASNIKSSTTRKNVQDAIVKVRQRLRLFKKVPENGLVLFCGAIPQDGPGSEKIEIHAIAPTEPIHVYLYRCNSKFYIGPLQEQLQEKETYGIVVIDLKATTFGTLKGDHLKLVKEITSGLPGKHRAGGQSARRFERLREAKKVEYFKRIGSHASEIFLSVSDLKGLILGGPGPTKYDFEKGNFLHYTLKDKVIAIIDTSYVSEQGLEEVVEKSPDAMRRIRYVEEKRIMQEFLYEIGHDTGLATYGVEDVKLNLEKGVVKNLLLSETLDVVYFTVKCNACGYLKQKTLKNQAFRVFEQDVKNHSCPTCNASSLYIESAKIMIDDLADLAEQSGANVEIISVETEEGQMLMKSFGGAAAVLRFSPSS